MADIAAVPAGHLMFSPARSIVLLGELDLDFPEPSFEVTRNLTVGRVNNEFITGLTNLGLANAGQLAEGHKVFIEFRGTTSTSDLMYPQRVAAALTLSSTLAVNPTVHIIVDLGVPGATTGTTLPQSDLSFRWGHYETLLTKEIIAIALTLESAIARVQLTDRYHRVGNALLFYMNGYNSNNPDLALVAFTTCLEGLFSTVEQEISFRLALRLAQFLGDSIENCII